MDFRGQHAHFRTQIRRSPEERTVTDRLRSTAATFVALAALTSAACSGNSPALSGPAAGAGGSGGAGLPTAAASAPASSLSKMRMRVVNVFDPKGAVGPALDIYDVQLNGQQATPVATNVAYGAASAYFTPHVPTGSFGQPVVELFALPAGEDPVTRKADAQAIGGSQDDGSHPQITWLLTADTGSVLGDGPLAGLSFSTRVEKGDSDGYKAPVAPAPPAGQGEILVDDSAVQGLNTELYLMLDGSCTPPVNGDTSMPGVPYIFNASASGIDTAFAIFPTAPGTHQVSLVDWSDSTPPSCAQLTAKQGGTSVDVAAGQQVEAYVYGSSTTDLHLVLAPVQQ